MRRALPRIGSALTVTTSPLTVAPSSDTLSASMSSQQATIALTVGNMFPQEMLSEFTITVTTNDCPGILRNWQFSNLQCVFKIYINCDYVIVVDIVMSKMYKIDNVEGGHPSYWQCTDCEYRSSHGGTMKRHIESKHIASKEYDCPQCGKLLSTIHQLRLHQKSKHPFIFQ